jgi:hypothetical protein
MSNRKKDKERESRRRDVGGDGSGMGEVREREKRDYVVYTEQTGGAVLLVE